MSTEQAASEAVDQCPTFLGYRFHRYPCPNAGRIDETATTIEEAK